MALLENVDNPSGIVPLDYYVLVELEKVEAKSKGGILLTDSQIVKQQWGETRAVILSVGPRAFCDADPPILDGERRHPRPGDRVWINQQTVFRIQGRDGKYYVVITDKDLIAFVSAETWKQQEDEKTG